MHYYGNDCILKDCTIAILMCNNKDFIIIIVPNYVFNKESTGTTHFGTHNICKVPYKGNVPKPSLLVFVMSVIQHIIFLPFLWPRLKCVSCEY